LNYNSAVAKIKTKEAVEIENGKTAWEYESDSIELYEMISTEFDYSVLREESLHFGIKQYKDSIFRGELHPET